MAEPAPLFLGHVDHEGRIRFERPEAFRAYCRRLAGKAIQVVVRRRTQPRSDRQNRYYWGVVVAMFAEELGYTPDEMHAALKLHLLRVADRGPLVTVRSTTALSTADYERYLEDCRTLAATLRGLVIPLPNEVDV